MQHEYANDTYQDPVWVARFTLYKLSTSQCMFLLFFCICAACFSISLFVIHGFTVSPNSDKMVAMTKGWQLQLHNFKLSIWTWLKPCKKNAKSKGHCSYVRDICRKGMYATVWEPPGISSHIGFESNDIYTHPADLMNVGSIAFSLFLLRNGITQMSAKMGSCIKGYENLKGSLLPTLITTAIKIGSKSTFKVSKIIRWRVLHGQSFTTSWNQDLKVWANSPFAFKLPNLKSRNKCIPWSGGLEYPWWCLVYLKGFLEQKRRIWKMHWPLSCTWQWRFPHL